MKTYEFVVYDDGDSSVGIGPTHGKVTIETNLLFDGEAEIVMAKQNIAELFDVRVTAVLTKAEQDEYDAEIAEYEKEMYEDEMREEMEKDRAAKELRKLRPNA